MINRRQFLSSLPFVILGCGQSGCSSSSSPESAQQSASLQPPLFPAGSFGSAGIMGGNLPYSYAWSPTRYYRNAAYQAQVITSYPMTLDSQGWPKSSCGLYLWTEGTEPNQRPTGTYNCQVFLPGTTSSTSPSTVASYITGVTVGNGSNGGAAPAFIAQMSAGQQYSDQQAGSYWSFTIIISGSTNINQEISFSTTGWSYLQVMYPQYTGYLGNTYGPYYPDDYRSPFNPTSYPPQTLWTQEILDMMKKYAVIRGLDFLNSIIVYPGSPSTEYGGQYTWINGTTLDEQGDIGSYTVSIPNTNSGTTCTITLPTTSYAWNQTTQTFSVYGNGALVASGQSMSGSPLSGSYQLTQNYSSVNLYLERPQFLAVTSGSNSTRALPTPAWRTFCMNDRSHEDFIDLANNIAAQPNSQLRGVWACIHIYANFDTLANGGYHATIANLYATKLSSNLCVYVENADEMWNTKFGNTYWAYNVRYDGVIPATSGSTTYLSKCYGYAYIFSQTVPIWRNAFGESGAFTSSSRCRPVYGIQTDYGPPISNGPTLYYGFTAAVAGTSPWSSPIITPSTMVWALGCTFYPWFGQAFESPTTSIFPGVNGSSPGSQLTTPVSEYDYLAAWYQAVTGNPGNTGVTPLCSNGSVWPLGYINSAASYASTYGVKLVCYEGDVGDYSSSPNATSDAALNSPHMTQLATTIYQAVVAAGVSDVMCYFRAEDTGLYLSNFNFYTSLSPFQATGLSNAIDAVFNAPMP